MAMLAEHRRKMKWSIHPRGKDWSQDTSKFGQKLLEKMGWSTGKGLGANLDGITEAIKVSYKNDSKGMGYKDHDDQWTQHESQFNTLLKSLEGSDNSNDGVKKEDEPKTPGFGFTGFQQSEPLTSVSIKDISGVSLEEKSKKSRARVHYHKFTRGKDISRYSAKDLANIFGKKTLATPEPVEAPKLNYGVVKLDQPEEKAADFSFGITATHSSLSINDYFKSKMPSYRKSKYKVGHNGVLCSVEDTEQENVENGFTGFKMETKSEDSSNLVDNEAGVIVEEENIKKSKKKKKKSKKSSEEDADLKETENVQSNAAEKMDVEQENCIPEESEKQKKKKKRKAEEVEVEIPLVSEEQPIKKKKKKSKDLDKIVEQGIVVKKSKKRKAENVENLEKLKEENVVNNEDEPSKPKKKKKKSKKHDLS